MGWKEIRQDIASIQEIIDGWIAGTAVSDLEKDIALEKLRRVYQTVKSAECRADVPFYAHTRDENTEVKEDKSTDSETGQEDISADNVLAEINETVEVSDDNTAEPVRSRIDRKALLSLYDDCPPEPEYECRPADTESSYGRGGEIKPPPVPVAGVPKKSFRDTADEWNHEDVITAQDRSRIGDTSAGEREKVRFDAESARNNADIASGHCTEPERPVKGGLRDEITPADRFAMIRDMFDSDEVAYERTIDRFDRFTDLGDAVVYMYENFSWNPADEGVKRFVDILERKLA